MPPGPRQDEEAQERADDGSCHTGEKIDDDSQIAAAKWPDHPGNAGRRADRDKAEQYVSSQGPTSFRFVPHGSGPLDPPMPRAAHSAAATPSTASMSQSHHSSGASCGGRRSKTLSP